MPFNFKKLDISDVVLVETRIFSDERGFFAEIYKSSDFKNFGMIKELLQVNYSKSKNNVLRGLHYQKSSFTQSKLISVLSGVIFDVAVDIRKGSPTFGKWVAVTLSSKDKKMLYIPEGFAHGFCVLSEAAEVVYYCSNIFHPEYEGGIIWNDPALNISWPVKEPILSEKDSRFPTLDKADNDFVYQGNVKE